MEWRGRTLWPHQELGHAETLAALDCSRQVCVTSPTGGGKSTMIGCLLDDGLNRGLTTVLYTDRKMLMDQLIQVLGDFGVPFGVRASGREDLADGYKPIQLAMIQTEQTRLRRAAHNLFPANRVLIDEAHKFSDGGPEAIIRQHLEMGASVIGYTATPMGLAHIYKRLVTAGTNSELRGYKTLVPCYVFAPDEPAAAAKLKRTKTGEYVQNDVVKAIMSPTIFGRVLHHFKRLNPDWMPSLLFGPGVAESLWFAQEFTKAGIRAAHIDGEHIWIDGEQHTTSQSLKDELKRESESGHLSVVCNRFVLREGIDWPFIRHGICATVFGSVVSYLQSVGRLLRASPGKDRCTLQDHGGNFWRHGSPNADRVWDLSLDPAKAAAIREERLRQKKEPEPIVCPQCGAVRLHGPQCVSCGHEHQKSVRMVVQTDGTLKPMTGDIFRPRVTKEKPSTQREWDRIFWSFKKSGKTFAQARGFFYHCHGYYPPENIPHMPTQPEDWHAKIEAVPWARMTMPERKQEPAIFKG